jgi:hypothetical protein
MIGAVATPAAALTATASASRRGTRRARSLLAHPGATTTIAAVAVTDRAKPASAASGGSASSSTITAAQSAGTADRTRPPASAINATPPITAARSTLAPD